MVCSLADAVEPCPGKKTLKTSTTTTTTRSRDVNGLLHSQLQKRRIGHDRRHFHQLFHQLWLTTQTDGLRCCTLFWEKNLELAAYHDHVELECRRPARRPNPVQRENLDDLHQKPKPAELES